MNQFRSQTFFKVKNAILSCNHAGQLDAAKKMIQLFRGTADEISRLNEIFEFHVSDQRFNMDLFVVNNNKPYFCKNI